MEIVYCGGCGKVLRPDDFARSLASILDHRPWCSDCRPVVAAPPRKAGSTAKMSRAGPGTTRRESGTSAPPRPLLLGGGLAAAVVVLLALYLGRASPPPQAPVDRAPRPPVDPSPRSPDFSDADRLLKDLESFASLSPPDRILARCEELAPKFRGTPQEARFRRIETGAREQKRTRDRETQFARELDALRTLIDEDARYARFDEVVRRLKAARELAGPRAPEVDQRLAEYQAARQSSPHEKHAGPFAEDDQGFLRNWLVLGVFPNDNDKGIDVDFLKSESAHDPAADLAVGTLKWGLHASPESKIDFFRVGHLGLRSPRDNVVAYAACLVENREFLASEFRLGTNDGGAIWVDGKPVGKVHKSRSLKIDEDRYAVPLNPGLHRVLLKVENHTKAFEFALRILSADGKRIPGLKIWN